MRMDLLSVDDSKFSSKQLNLICLSDKIITFTADIAMCNPTANICTLIHGTVNRSSHANALKQYQM